MRINPLAGIVNLEKDYYSTVKENEDHASPIIEDEDICYSGWMYIVVNKKDRGKFWTVLRKNQLMFYENENKVSFFPKNSKFSFLHQFYIQICSFY